MASVPQQRDSGTKKNFQSQANQNLAAKTESVADIARKKSLEAEAKSQDWRPVDYGQKRPTPDAASAWLIARLPH